MLWGKGLIWAHGSKIQSIILMSWPWEFEVAGTPHPHTGSRERWSLVLRQLAFKNAAQDPGLGMEPHIFRVCLLTSVDPISKIPHRHNVRFISMAILTFIQSTRFAITLSATQEQYRLLISLGKGSSSHVWELLRWRVYRSGDLPVVSSTYGL